VLRDRIAKSSTEIRSPKSEIRKKAEAGRPKQRWCYQNACHRQVQERLLRFENISWSNLGLTWLIHPQISSGIGGGISSVTNDS